MVKNVDQSRVGWFNSPVKLKNTQQDLVNLHNQSTVINEISSQWLMYQLRYPFEQHIHLRRQASHLAFLYTTVVKSCLYNDTFEVLDGIMCQSQISANAVSELWLTVQRDGVVLLTIMPRYGVAQQVDTLLQKLKIDHNIDYYCTHNRRSINPSLDSIDFGLRPGFLIPVNTKYAPMVFAQVFLVLNPVMDLDEVTRQRIVDYLEFIATINFHEYQQEIYATDKEKSIKKKHPAWKNFKQGFPLWKTFDVLLPLPETYYTPCPNPHNLRTIDFLRAYIPHKLCSYPKQRPALHHAILREDENEVVAILSKDPFAVFQADGLGGYGGREPLDLVLSTNYSLCLKLYEHAQRWVHLINCPWLTEKIRHMLLILNHSDPQCWENVLTGHRQLLQQVYLPENNLPHPARPLLHDACAKGDIETVDKILQQNPSLVDSQDPWKLTPLLIAVGEGHYELTELLLEKYKAKIDFCGEKLSGRLYHPLLNTKDRKMLQLLARRRIDLDQVRYLSEMVLHTHNRELLEIILGYLPAGSQTRAHITGLTLIEEALFLAQMRGDLEVLDDVLTWYKVALPEGPYDQNISKQIQQIIYAHNAKIHQRQINRRLTWAKYEYQPEKGRIINHFNYLAQNTSLILTAEIVATANLTVDERQQLYGLFEQRFGALNSEPHLSLAKLFNAIFPQHNSFKPKQSQYFVELYKIKDKIIGCAAFNIVRPAGENAVIYKILLAMIAPDWIFLGLGHLFYRIPVGWEIPTHFWQKNMMPCIALNLIEGLEYFPKFKFDPAYIKWVNEVVGVNSAPEKSPGGYGITTTAYKVIEIQQVKKSTNNYSFFIDQQQAELKPKDPVTHPAIISIFPLNPTNRRKIMENMQNRYRLTEATIRQTSQDLTKLCENMNSNYENHMRLAKL
ncbi:MAG: hypothetical protein Tsb005_10590 [Gammaproteobacteria bacterium]